MEQRLLILPFADLYQAKDALGVRMEIEVARAVGQLVGIVDALELQIVVGRLHDAVEVVGHRGGVGAEVGKRLHAAMGGTFEAHQCGHPLVVAGRGVEEPLVGLAGVLFLLQPLVDLALEKHKVRVREPRRVGGERLAKLLERLGRLLLVGVAAGEQVVRLTEQRSRGRVRGACSAAS